MIFLIDYDNYEYNNKLNARKGLFYLAEKLINVVNANTATTEIKTRIRLYGGWYENKTLTRKAHTLITEASNSFPAVITTVNIAGATHKVIVNIELAYSLEIAPSTHLFNTFRARSAPKNLHCRNPLSLGCSEPHCPMQNMYSLFSTGNCPSPSCRRSLDDLIYKGEQKLVDTMMALDALYVSTSGIDTICFLTSDDDFWPVMLTLLTLGKKVIHVHTISGRRTSKSYCRGISCNYTEIDI